LLKTFIADKWKIDFEGRKKRENFLRILKEMGLQI
jgi:hypothetical protein